MDELKAKFKAEHDDYNAIMADALADRLAEAFAERLHKIVRDEWGYGRQENLSAEDMIKERYRGIRPAPGYPACPDHTEKRTLFDLMTRRRQDGYLPDGEFRHAPGKQRLRLLHSASRVALLPGRQDRKRSGGGLRQAARSMEVTTVERWLAPNLNYDPER